ncbi:MAG: hypothetical protein FJ291_22450 [Planctomycetes bacterium]|nr:hypothetical protein [Planctomycetota bacterium]
MSSSPPPEVLDSLPPAELERRMQEHLDAMWSELQAAGEELRAHYHPLNVAARHPLATAAAAGALAALGLRALRRAAAPPAPPAPAATEPLGRGIVRSLLSSLASAAGRALPTLAAAWASRAGPNEQQHTPM